MNRLSLLLFYLCTLTMGSVATLQLFVEENIDTQTVTFTLSGTADISGLTPDDTRSGSAYFGADGFRFGPTPIFSDPTTNHVQFHLYELDAGYPNSFFPAASEFIQGNWLLDGTRSPEQAFDTTVGMLQWQSFTNSLTTNAFLALPTDYSSGSQLTNQVTFLASQLSDFDMADSSLTNGISWASWGDGQDTFTLQTSVIPEPTTLASILSVSLGLIAFRSAQRKAREHRPAPPSAL